MYMIWWYAYVELQTEKSTLIHEAQRNSLDQIEIAVMNMQHLA